MCGVDSFQMTESNNVAMLSTTSITVHGGVARAESTMMSFTSRPVQGSSGGGNGSGGGGDGNGSDDGGNGSGVATGTAHSPPL